MKPQPAIRVIVNNRRCHQYGICQAEAGKVFQLHADGQLLYDHRPPEGERERTLMAARHCPMQAITIVERAR
ncbi:MAG TPA: ferredoxin [Pseudonocardiaceae bacterium]|nr:ferredoxin [Pseudonocardiaceae bacterium]